MPNGTILMDKKQLTKATGVLNAKEICYIVKACSEAGVTELKFGDLEVIFGGEASSLSEKATPALMGFTENRAYQKEQQPAKLARDALSAKLSLFDTKILEEIDKSQLMIEDPIGYEQFVVDEQLSRDAGNHGETEDL